MPASDNTVSHCQSVSRQPAAEWPDSSHGPVSASRSLDRKSAPLQQATLGLLLHKAGPVQPHLQSCRSISLAAQVGPVMPDRDSPSLAVSSCKRAGRPANSTHQLSSVAAGAQPGAAEGGGGPGGQQRAAHLRAPGHTREPGATQHLLQLCIQRALWTCLCPASPWQRNAHTSFCARSCQGLFASPVQGTRLRSRELRKPAGHMAAPNSSCCAADLPAVHPAAAAREV